MPLFRKILIANRGEIAVRILRACRELGIAGVSVYSEADRDALHVRLADEAYLIGPAPAVQSYLVVERIIEAAQRSGAEAVHPGYGFLSERAALAHACVAAGIVFIGPPAAAIEAMGSKIAAKRLAVQAGVPTLPGYDGAEQSPERLRAEAELVGFPLLIKASAGGGGKGMRAVHTAGEFVAALEGARREALAAFGDDAVLLERLLRRPRHVEIQVFADAHGSVVHLGERECSIQRRHQKIIEESPSPALDGELRAAMGAAAVRVAAAAGYINAGTVEFLLDQDRSFYFLEMNTRLQVEHAVTELVTGLDLVQLQIAVAAGERLPLAQEQLRLRGHAVEARLYAEDPASYLPATGTLERFAPPAGEGVRNDVGVERGSVVGIAYDPLLAKLIVFGDDRAAAIERLRAALDAYEVVGVTTNLPLLRAVAAHPAFAAGATSTAFLDEHQLNLTPPAPPLAVLAAAAAYQLQRAGIAFGPLRDDAHALSPWQSGPWRLGRAALPFRYRYQGGEHALVAGHEGGARWRFELGNGHQAPGTRAAGPQQSEGDSGAIGYRLSAIGYGQALAVEIGAFRPGAVVLHVAGQALRLRLREEGDGLVLAWQGREYRLLPALPLAVDGLALGAGEGGEHDLSAPMPGTIVRLLVREGEAVELNQPLLVLEAMKMEHTIASPYAGVVARLLCAEGQLVSAGAPLIEIAA